MCVETYNRQKHSPIQCRACDFTACRECIKRYLLESTLEPTCMKCKVAWTQEFVRQHLPKTFMNGDYKVYRENMLLSLEESLLPQTQDYAKYLSDLERERKELVELRNLINTLKNDYSEKQMAYYRKCRRGYNASSQSKRQFVMKCPDNECRGFLSQHYRCGQCSKSYCKDCYALKTADEEEHTCNEDDVKTVELLHKNTKRCPNCAISIYKVDGCFAKGVPIRMYDGSVKMSQDVRENDVLMGDDGTPRTVVRTMTGQDTMYRVKMARGSYVVSSKHTLIVKYRHDKRVSWFNKKNAWMVVWYDREHHRERSKVFRVNAETTREQARARADAFVAGMDFPSSIEMLAATFCTLSPYLQTNMLGIVMVPSTKAEEGEGGMRTVYGNVSVERMMEGEDTYYGWETDGNHRFLHEDGTVLSNCSQMWCTECHTAFSWTTGQIINGVIHNPHYFEWQRQLRERGEGNDDTHPHPENACRNDQIPTIRLFRFLTFAEQNIVVQLIQALTHVREVVVPSLMSEQDRFLRNRDLRIQYLNKEIDKDRFKWMIQKRDKADQKKAMVAMVWQMFVMSYVDLLHNLRINRDYEGFRRQSTHILEYVNSEFDRISTLYNAKVRHINDRWQLVNG